MWEGPETWWVNLDRRIIAEPMLFDRDRDNLMLNVLGGDMPSTRYVRNCGSMLFIAN